MKNKVLKNKVDIEIEIVNFIKSDVYFLINFCFKKIKIKLINVIFKGIYLSKNVFCYFFLYINIILFFGRLIF